MITYQLLINNIPHGTIQAISRIEAVRLANEVHGNMAGTFARRIHLSKLENWTTL